VHRTRLVLFAALRLVAAAFLAFGAAKSFDRGGVVFSALGVLLAAVALTAVLLFGLAVATAFQPPSADEA
jgi:hypothetical protein